VTTVNDTVLAELIYGKGAHTEATAIVEGVSVELAGALPAGAPNSIFQLVSHINYWVDYELRRLAGQDPAYPEHAAESWPGTAVPRTGEWEATVARFKVLLDGMARLARDAAALDRAVTVVNTEHYANQGSSVRDVLYQTAVHNSYHLGQVAFLRRMLGIWPPAGGSDTW
jgi:uncharacterized damage-inducible protein DinB